MVLSQSASQGEKRRSIVDKKPPVLLIGGCSGSSTAPSSQVTRHNIPKMDPVIRPFHRSDFGMNTTGFGIISEGVGLSIDNGTGAQPVAQYLLKRDGVGQIFGLQTHFHKDHKMGTHENALYWGKGLLEKSFAPLLGGRTWEEIFKTDFVFDSYPASPEMLGISHSFENFKCGEVLPILGGIKTLALNHPGGACGYRIQTPEGDVAIVTDHDIGEDLEGKYSTFVSGAKLLYADVQYRDAEYEGKIGIGREGPVNRSKYGHSSPNTFFAALQKCSELPKKVLIGHHDPKRPDEDLYRFEAEMQKQAGGLCISLEFAREGKVYEI